MQMISDLVRNIQTIAVAVMVTLFVFGAIGVYLLKYKKKNVQEVAVDYSQFVRKDVMEYVKIDDVAEDMLVTDGGKRFIGAIKCQGFSFADAEIEEKLQTIRGYITFFNVLDNNSIQFRQSARDVNLDKLIQSYQEQMKKLDEKRFTMNLDYTEMKTESEDPQLSIEDYNIYYEKLKLMQRELLSLGYQIDQLNAQVQYMLAISGENAEAKREEIYVFDWEYKAADFSSQKLEETEVYLRAEGQLKEKASAYMTALRNCGVHAKRMTGVELLEEIRRYTHPVSASKGTVEDIVQTAYNSICVTSNSLRELEEQTNGKIVEELALEVQKERRKMHA